MRINKIKTFVRKLNIRTLFLAFILLYTIVPIVAVATSKFATTYSYMVVVVIAVMYTFNACRLGDIRDYALLLVPFILYELLIMVSTGNSNVLLAGYQVLLFLLPVCIGYTLLKGVSSYAMYTAIVAIAFAVTAVTTIIGCIIDPDAARVLATIKTSQDPTSIKYLWRNIGGYGFVYSAVLLYPCAILAYKLKKLPLLVLIPIGVLAFYLAINAQYTFALMLLMVSTLLLFVKKTISLGKFVVLVFAFVIGVFIFRELVALILTRIGEWIGNPAMTEKMTAVFIGKEAVDNMDDPRGMLYMMSVNTFLNNPFFGTFASGGRGSGGHSFILDNLALFGIIGGALMAFMYQGIYKVFYRPLKGKPGYCIVFWIFLQPIILSAINTGMWLQNLCMLSPLILCTLYGNDMYQSDLAKKRTLIPIQPLVCKESRE